MARAWQPTRRPAALRVGVSPIVIFAAVATVATGLVIRHASGGLGTATPPFVMGWAPRLHALALISVAGAAGAAILAPRLARRPLTSLAFCAGVLALALALGLAINLARSGVPGWYAIFDTGAGGSFEARNEYLPGLPALTYGTWFYLDHFAELVPSLPVNVAGHPPGPLLLVQALGISTASGAAALCIAVGALGAPLTYVLARALHPESVARAAAVLYACCPLALLFGVTSFDYLYATLGLAAACLLVRRSVSARAAGAVALALAALFSWALLAIAAWAVVVVWRRDGARHALAVAAGCAIAVIAVDGALAVAYGYDPIGTLRATEAVYRNSIARQRPYAFWVFGSPVAWGVMLGVPIVLATLRALRDRNDAAVALALVVVVAAVGGFTKAETERIWLFLVPLACVAAATGGLSQRRLGVAVTALIAQALVVQVLFDTVW